MPDPNQTILRPNSKGPLTNSNIDFPDQSELQSAASNEKRQPSTSPKFQIPSKQSVQPSGSGSGNKNSQWGNINSIVKPTNNNNGFGQSGVSPAGTADKRDKPQQDKLSTGGNGNDNDGTGDGSKGSGNRNSLGYQLIVVSVVTIAILTI